MGVQPGNPVVGGIMLRIPAIRSPGYIAGVQGWTINIDGSAEFNNVVVRGELIGKDYIINTDGIFFYSGTPALGNLVLSVSATSGTDQFGNTYPAGVNIMPVVQTMPAMENGWSVGGHATYALDPLQNLILSWGVLNVGTNVDTTEIWPAGSLPSPPTPRRMTCFADALRATGGGSFETAALEIQTDGSVQCFGFANTATRADLFAIVPMAF